MLNIQVAITTLGSSSLAAHPRVAELQLAGADGVPVGTTLCFQVELTQNAHDLVRLDGFLTFFEQGDTSAGIWVRRRVELEGSLLKCFTNNDNGKDEEVYVSLF
jgi:hypothetical protein